MIQPNISKLQYFCLFNAIFICAAYLFTLLKCFKSSFLSSLRVRLSTIQSCLNLILCISIFLHYGNHFWLYEIVLKLSGDIEENPGPKPSSNQHFSIFHRNLNRIFAHNYIKISLSRAYLFTHKFDFLCISEIYLDSDISDDNDNLKIAGYNLIRADIHLMLNEVDNFDLNLDKIANKRLYSVQ